VICVFFVVVGVLKGFVVLVVVVVAVVVVVVVTVVVVVVDMGFVTENYSEIVGEDFVRFVVKTVVMLLAGTESVYLH